MRIPHPRERQPRPSRERPQPGGPADGSAGYSLVEFVVAMGIFAAVLALVASGVTLMTRDVVRTTNLSTATDSMRATFTRLDRQVRYAAAINRPVRVGNTWYLEFQALDGDGVLTCRQWRLVTDSDTLQQRSWTGTPAVAPGWTTVVTGIANDPTTEPPFTFIKAGESVAGAAPPENQGLTVLLVGRRPVAQSPTLRLSTGMSARNSKPSSVTNDDINADGVSDTEVCREVARS